MKYIKPQQNIISKFILQCGEAKIYANEKKKTTKFFKGEMLLQYWLVKKFQNKNIRVSP